MDVEAYNAAVRRYLAAAKTWQHERAHGRTLAAAYAYELMHVAQMEAIDLAPLPICQAAHSTGHLHPLALAEAIVEIDQGKNLFPFTWAVALSQGQPYGV